MTVKSVWGRIQRQIATLTSHEGDVWTFDVPPWASSPIIVEFWAEDEAGNVSYKTGIFTLEEGQKKCIRWLKEGSSCIMLSDGRPTAEDLSERPIISILSREITAVEAMPSGKPTIDMLDHACSRLVEVY